MTAKYLTSNNLNKHPNVIHGFFTRIGGISEGIYASLNCGYGSKDSFENVKANRTNVAEVLKSTEPYLITPYQIHSANAVIAETPWNRQDAPQADAIVTNKQDIRIGILTADCGPILFSDPKANIIGAAHSGWKGAIGGVLEATIEKMESLGSDRNNISVAIGPSISQESYEIGPEFEKTFLDHGPENADFFKQFPSGKSHFDLTGFITHRLKKAHIKEIECLQQCTVLNESQFFSYRRSCHRKQPDYGRQISVIGLK